jgi:hypothetical protein
VGTFAEEAVGTKLQLITSLTKLRLRQPTNAKLAVLHRYAMTLARCARLFLLLGDQILDYVLTASKSYDSCILHVIYFSYFIHVIFM